MGVSSGEVELAQNKRTHKGQGASESEGSRGEAGVRPVESPEKLTVAFVEERADPCEEEDLSESYSSDYS
jgi:hypothetical protein